MRRALATAFLFVSLAAKAGFATLEWDASTDAEGYRVYWGAQSRQYTNSIDVGNTLTGTITGLVNTVRYYFAVTSYNLLGESDYSAEVSAVIPPLPPPEGLVCIQGRLGWVYPVTSDTLHGFAVFWREVGVKRTQSLKVPATSWQADLSGLLPGSTYRIWVSAFTRNGRLTIYSDPSAVLEWTVPAGRPGGGEYLWPPEEMDNGHQRIVVFSQPGERWDILGAQSVTASWENLGSAAEFLPGQYRFEHRTPWLASGFYRAVKQ